MLCQTDRGTGELRTLWRVNPLVMALSMALLPASGLALAEAPDMVAVPVQAGRDGSGKPVAHDAGAGHDVPVELPALTVTARQGVERAKDIPFGLSVISGRELEVRHLLTLDDALRSMPDVNVNSNGGPNSANVMIRGVGSLNAVSMDDGSVALNVDGVTMSMRNMSLGTLDIERVEVLKGPQGTLFGGNSLAGAVNVTTRRPTREMEGHVRVEYGQERQHLEEAVISGPLSGQLSGRFAIRNTGSDLWVDNTQTGQPLSKPGDLAFRGSLLWDVTAGTSALLIAERQQVRRSPSLTILRPYGEPPKLDFTPNLFDDDKKTMARYSLELNHDLGASRITSITAYTTTDFFTVGGYDRRIMQALMGGTPEASVKEDSSAQRGVSEDLRWSSLPGAPLFWVAGLNLSHADRHFDTYYMPGYRQDRRYRVRSSAVYGEATYPLTDALKLTGGLRQSWDRKSYDATYTQGSSSGDNRELDDHYTTGRVALSYALTPASNLYVVLSRGYQSGGFSDYSATVAGGEPYKPARSNTAELGFKTESADRRFSLNAALFATRVRDAHLLGYDYKTYSTNTVNADSDSKGVELEGYWRFGDGFELSGGLSVIDATITSDALGVSGGDVRAGNRTPDVPRWGGNLALSYRKPLPSFLGLPSPAVNARLGYQYVGARPADPQNHFDLGSYRRVDLRVGLTAGNAEIYLYGNNLLDEQYDLYGYYNNATATFGSPVRGRTAGIGLNYHF